MSQTANLKGDNMGPEQQMEQPEIFLTSAEAQKYLEHLLENGDIQFQTLDQVRDGYMECVDGRQDMKCITGTPGGDEAELILALRASETVLGTELTEKQILDIVGGFIESKNRFYMHTDLHAAHDLVHDLAKDPDFAQIAESTKALANNHEFGESDYVEFIKNIPEDLREKLLSNYLTNPKYIGCGHLKLMLGDVEGYKTRETLVKTAIKAFYGKLWDGNHTILTVLKHDHKEQAVIVVKTEEEINSDTLIPVVTPFAEKQVFIYNPQVAQLIGEGMARFVSQQLQIETDDVIENMHGLIIDQMHELRDVQTDNTVGTLATNKGKKVFTATFKNRSIVSVE